MKTEKTITRIGRTFEVHESLGKQYIKCDRCEKQWDTVTQAASCCAEEHEQKQVKTLAKNIAFAERQKAKAAGEPVPEGARRKRGRKPGAKKPAMAKAAPPAAQKAANAAHPASAPIKALQSALDAVNAQIASLEHARAKMLQAYDVLEGGAA